MINIISASELKNNVSEILSSVYFSGDEAIIEKYGKPIVKIISIKKLERSKEELKSALDATFGSLPDFPDVTKFRRSGRRKIPSLF